MSELSTVVLMNVEVEIAHGGDPAGDAEEFARKLSEDLLAYPEVTAVDVEFCDWVVDEIGQLSGRPEWT